MPFTADEVWPLIPGHAGETVHVAEFRASETPDTAVLERWAPLLEVRERAMKVLEEARAAKTISSGLEACLTLRGPAKALQPLREFDARSAVFPGNLANLVIVSGVDLQEAEGEVAVEVRRAEGGKCERCWTYSRNVGKLPEHPGVCERCAAVLGAGE
jgi:isoleucyl-tRNA synthetase